MIRAKIRNKYKSIIFLLLLFFCNVKDPYLVPITNIGGGIRQQNALYQKRYNTPAISVSDLPIRAKNQNEYSPPGLKEFTAKIIDGKSRVIFGIFSAENFALNVVQQPSNVPGFVSSINGVATQFSLPSSYGVIGFLAHNYLSGILFFSLDLGDEVKVIYGDGEIKGYRVVQIRKYQAIEPNSTTSEFIDLETGEKIRASELFKEVYFGDHHITLQTCIEKDGIDSWGRMFVIADPI